MKYRAFLLSLLFVVQMVADAPIVSELRGLRLVGSAGAVTDYPEEIVGFSVYGLCVPGALSGLESSLTPLYLGQPLTEEKVSELKGAICTYWAINGHPFICVYLPEQDITAGVLQLVVIESTVGAICRYGDRWYSNRLIADRIDLHSGCPIDVNSVLYDLGWVNRNPFHETYISYAPGEASYTTDVRICTLERFPLRLHSGYDNTGTRFTGRDRLFIGITWGNALWQDGIATYQYTSGTYASMYQAHIASYVAPLPWRHILSFFGGYSQVRPHIENFRQLGKLGQASIRYELPILRYSECCHTMVRVGFDWKAMNSNLQFIDQSGQFSEPLIANTVNVSQFMAGVYHFKRSRGYQLIMDGEFFWQPGQLMHGQTLADYNRIAPGADNRYWYVKGSAVSQVTLTGCWKVCALARVQGASRHLLPSEQVGMGGFDTIRGWDQREFNADNAVILNLELRTPPLSCLPRLRCRCSMVDELEFLAFIDYGAGNDVVKPVGLDPMIYLLGVGPGLRYRVADYLHLRLDWGVRLFSNQLNSNNDRWNQWYIGVVLSY